MQGCTDHSHHSCIDFSPNSFFIFLGVHEVQGWTYRSDHSCIDSPCYNMPSLPLSTSGDIKSNSFYPIAAKTCINTLFFQSRYERGMPYNRRRWRLISWTSSKPASQVPWTNAAPNCFYPALSGAVIVNCTFFPYYFLFWASCLIVSIDGSWLLEDRDRDS